jgi:hypothetical protein
MNITDYILNEIKPIPLNSGVKTAKKLFDNFPITHFTVVENSDILGSFAREDIQAIENNSDELVVHSNRFRASQNFCRQRYEYHTCSE